MAAKRGLGRGFESLIPTDLIDDSFNPNNTYDPTAAEDQTVSHQKVLPISSLRVDAEQPRKAFDEEALEELAASIKEHGVIQPLIVAPLGSDTYQIVAGERRYRASKKAGLTEVPVVVRTFTDQNRLEISLIENIQRRDLNSVEMAVAYAKLRDQFNLTGEQIAGRVHKSPSAVANTMRLLKLPKIALEALAEGLITEGQARPLVGQEEPLVAELIPRIIAESWSARKIEQYMVNKKKRSAEVSENASQAASGNGLATEHQHEARIQTLRDRLQAKVDIRINNKGAGKIVIPFKSIEEFERIQNLLDQ